MVGVFPNPAALLRLAGVVLVEQHDEWEAGDRRYLSEASVALVRIMEETPATVMGEGISLAELAAASSFQLTRTASRETPSPRGT